MWELLAEGEQLYGQPGLVTGNMAGANPPPEPGARWSEQHQAWFKQDENGQWLQIIQ